MKKYLSEAEWRTILSPEAFRVLRQAGTERPFTGHYTDTPASDSGIYVCAACEAPLFPARFKFPSHCGWPAFARPHADACVELKQDHTMGMQRIEVRCKSCDSHLGHVFNDGPSHLGGTRYCINSIALKLKDEDYKYCTKE